MVNNFSGDLSVFKRPEHKIDSHLHQQLIRSFKDDTLLEVLLEMKQKRISLVPIEEKNDVQAGHEILSHTIGLVFLSDLLFLLRLPNYWELLNQPVSDFLEELYGQYGDNDLSRSIEASSSAASSHAGNKQKINDANEVLIMADTSNIDD